MENKKLKIELRNKLRKAQYRVYTIVKHNSKSGMFRLISCYIVVDKKIICIDWYIKELGLFKIDRERSGLRVSGCDMDMGFHVVYSLSGVLYNKAKGRSDGGYMLEQQWL